MSIAQQQSTLTTAAGPVALGIFTRPPHPGTCKTRLIPHLGANGAAAIARRLAQATAAAVADFDEAAVSLWLTGPVEHYPPEFRALWPERVTLRSQCEGDLGARLELAAATHFAAGATACLLIGTDCPELTTTHLREAAHALAKHDLVLGPALDGGYTLIGTCRPLPELFRDMPWSTEHLLAATRARARSLGLRWYELQTLGDVDTADDLPRLTALFRRDSRRLPPDTRSSPAGLPSRANVSRPHQPTTQRAGDIIPGRVSVIIPSRGDTARLEALLDRLHATATGSIELLILSAEADPALDRLADKGARVTVEAVSRAVRLNAGAAQATGEFLLFLHADAWPPEQFDARVRETLAQRAVSLGAFALGIEGDSSGLLWVEHGANWRSRVLGLPYGDQGLFCRAKDFWQVGGFPAWPLLDDVELVQRLRHLGRSEIVNAPMLVSARRWTRLGIPRTTLLNQAILAAWFLGVSPDRLADWYRGKA